VDTEAKAEPKAEATTKRGGTTGASAVTMSPRRTGNSSVLSGTSAAGKTTSIASSPVACDARNRQAPNRANTAERRTCGGLDALKTTDCCGEAATKGRGRGSGDPTSPTNVTALKLWATTCTSTPGEHDLRGEEADPEGPTSLARQSGRVDSSRPLERTSTSSEREVVRPAECGEGGPAAEGDATWAGPPPTDDPPEAARATMLTDEEPSKLLKTPADGWMPCNPYSG
jgi:hypothetical protein